MAVICADDYRFQFASPRPRKNEQVNLSYKWGRG